MLTTKLLPEKKKKKQVKDNFVSEKSKKSHTINTLIFVRGLFRALLENQFKSG